MQKNLKRDIVPINISYSEMNQLLITCFLRNVQFLNMNSRSQRTGNNGKSIFFR